MSRDGFAPSATEESPYADGGLPERGIDVQAELDCRIAGGVRIYHAARYCAAA